MVARPLVWQWAQTLSDAALNQHATTLKEESGVTASIDGDKQMALLINDHHWQ